MSELAAEERERRKGWASPGGLHDRLIGVMKVALPSIIGVLLAYLAVAPLSKTHDISFILDKNKVDVAKERMKLQSARYQGQDNKGRPFTINAGSAVQPTSQSPIVDINSMSANIQLNDGPATIQAQRGNYNLESQKVAVVGPILVNGPDNYRLTTSDVTVDLSDKTMESRGAAQGTMPLGTFSGDALSADLDQKKVTLTGRARLHIVQGKHR
jgi:lipopolysaccharide export system protein LptC